MTQTVKVGINHNMKIEKGTPEIEKVTPEWVNQQCEKFGISKKKLAAELGLNYKNLITTLSENGRGNLVRDSQKSRFVHFFETLELKKELRQAKLDLDYERGSINEAKYKLLSSLDDRIINKQGFKYNLETDTITEL